MTDMPLRTMTIAERVTQVSRLNDERKTFDEMLAETGLQPTTLRAYLARAGLHMPRRFRLEVRLSGDLTSAMIMEAGRRGIPPVQLVTTILDLVAEDKLFAAILDQ